MAVRLIFAHYLALGLKFQLAADILSMLCHPVEKNWQTGHHCHYSYRPKFLFNEGNGAGKGNDPNEDVVKPEGDKAHELSKP